MKITYIYIYVDICWKIMGWVGYLNCGLRRARIRTRRCV